MTTMYKPGARVRVPWGLDQDREGVIVDVWGDERSPTQVRVQLDPMGEGDEPASLLLPPTIITLAAAA